MKKQSAVLAIVIALAFAPSPVSAQNLLTNGNLDITQPVEIVPAFFLPKPASWVNEGSRSISGPYEDEMSSEPWAGPAPTPLTTDGSGAASPNGCGGLDCAVFFKPFSGNTSDGTATGHLYQDHAATPGVTYTLTGWAGAEPNFLGGGKFALDFLNAGGTKISAAELDLVAAGLFTDNGLAFDYKEFSVSAIAPDGTATVRARASMIDALSNPLGGGQAFVIDDFELTAVPEPSTAVLAIAGMVAVVAVSHRRRRAAV
ncbi:MAG: PEP-CTERM sorting domain-containing protein [Planctomycetia bacterium]|nr:PEP-CTERM sorting domain-containing protein [Planctomycetia bacterium]